ncbi:MAG: hypothetical protein P8P88_05820 [Polaribacter sp.]|nr:hypothetical protein [Polaribacter sp.]
MKYQLLLFSFFFALFTSTQGQIQLFKGKIIYEEEVIKDVHVVNKRTNHGTNSNDFGLFEIPVFVGDTLVISHINFMKKEVIVTEKNMNIEILKIELNAKTYQLEEITFQKPKSLFYIDPEILPPPIVNAKTLKLPYANTKKNTDKNVVKFNSGSIVSLENLTNTLNGNNRRKRQLQKMNYEDNKLAKIRKYFSDDFFISDLNIKPEKINIFLNYCLNKNIITHFNNKDKLGLTAVLITESRTFPQDKTEISLKKQ